MVFRERPDQNLRIDIYIEGDKPPKGTRSLKI